MAQSLKKLHSFFLLTFTIASIASDMSRHMNGFAILDSIIFRNAIEFTAIAVLAIIIVARPVAEIFIWLHVSGSRDIAYINQNLSIIFFISLSTVTVPSSSIKI